MLRKLSLLLIAGLLMMAGFAIGTNLTSTTATPVQQVALTSAASINASYQQASTDLTQANAELTADEQMIADVYNYASPSVVSIYVASGQGAGGGTGFVIDTEGHIVTNYHVAGNVDEIIVEFLDGTITRAEVVGGDADADIAVLQVDVPQDRLYPLAFGSSDDLIVGQTVLAIGSPFGEEWTLTSGIVSALERTIEGLAGYSIGSAIQTDAAINPGNSGGPLLNLRGEVVGVNAQIRTESGSNSGIGFAIPSVLVERVAQELIQNGEVDYSLIGIRGADVDIYAIEALNLANNQRGVVVSEATQNGPAAEAGLRNAQVRNRIQLVNADVITAIDGTALDGMNDLISYLALYTEPGQQVNLTVLRDGQTINVPVTLGARSDFEQDQQLERQFQLP
jgi:S1-C subfamily serine protease